VNATSGSPVTTVVVGVDGSLDSAAAVGWVVTFAAVVDAHVVAVHALGLLEHERSDPDHHRLIGMLHDWTRGLDGLPAEHVERRLVPGSPGSSILQMAEAVGADLVVVGTRGEGARGHTLLGSTSLELAERCPCPLVIVPRTWPSQSP